MIRLRQAFHYLFGFRQPVRRLPYALVGFGLMAVKYVGDMAILRAFDQASWTPAQYFSPLYATRFSEVAGLEVLLALGLFALPFVWIGASMTYRRCVDVGLPGAMALFFFVPGLNYVLMLPLCLIPTWSDHREPSSGSLLGAVSGTRRLLLSVAVAAGFGLLVFGAGVALSRSYGAALFVGSPFAIGFVAAALQGSRHGDDDDGPVRKRPVAAGQMALLVAGGALLLLGLEGIICLAMAYPLAAVLAFVGSQLGSLPTVTGRWHRGSAHLFLLVALLPFLAAMERPGAPLREVVTTVDVDAPPEVVWRHVVEFAELPPPNDWLFRSGIAYPMRARIDGRGIGAVRHCEFSTGAFVEPITRWDEPDRLSFDVVAQPPTMQEWSPYRHVEPAHLTETLRSERGEFRLVRLPDGGTRLEGSTWYRLEMAPQPYWTLWSDAIIHRIHRRVLRHVASLIEAEQAAAQTVGS